MNENKNICPCCGKGCDLSAPRCPRGEEYLRTGVIPSRGEHKPHSEREQDQNCHHEGKHGQCGHGRHEHEHSHGGHGNHEHEYGHGEHCCHKREHEHDHKEHQSEHKGNRFSHYNEMGTNDKILAQMSKLTHSSHAVLGGRGGQKRILHILSKEGSMTQRELTERLDIQPGSASEIIKKLEAAGCIVRTANEADRRTADISLTEAGKAQVQELGAERSRRLDELFSALTAEESQQLLSLLEKLSADWDTRCKDGKRHERGHHHKEG